MQHSSIRTFIGSEINKKVNSNLGKLINLIRAKELESTTTETLLSIVSQIEQEVLAEKQTQNQQIARYKNTISDLQNIIQKQQNEFLSSNHVLIKEKLLANISHEFRTPLNAIVGMTHLLQNTTLDYKQQHFLDVTKTAADNLILMINDLLELSSINEKSIHLQLQPFSIEKLFTELYSIVWFKAKQKQLDLTFNISNELPEYLNGDNTRLHQILMNLLTNAIKFTHKGKVVLDVKAISKKNKTVYIEVKVTDTGIGIAKDKLPNLFETFTRLHDNKKEVYVGLGSGLNIVKQLVDKMDGQISVQSELNKGTSFSILIPFQISNTKEVKEHISQQKFSIEKILKSKEILYIEDNHANILYVKNMLSSKLKRFDAAEDFIAATQLLNNRVYDCILSDVKLPEGSGIDYIEQLRNNQTAINQTTPVIVVTAGATKSEYEKAQAIGVEAYINKPFSPDTLFKELQQIFTKKDDIQSLLAFYPHPKPKKSKESEDYLKHLHKVMNGNKKAMMEMIDIFLKQLPDSIRKMEIAVEKKDWHRVHFEAHKVKSTIGIIGLTKLQKTILTINESTRERKNLNQVPLLFEQFKKQGEIEVKKLIIERKKISKKK